MVHIQDSTARKGHIRLLRLELRRKLEGFSSERGLFKVSSLEFNLCLDSAAPILCKVITQNGSAKQLGVRCFSLALPALCSSVFVDSCCMLCTWALFWQLPWTVESVVRVQCWDVSPTAVGSCCRETIVVLLSITATQLATQQHKPYNIIYMWPILLLCTNFELNTFIILLPPSKGQSLRPFPPGPI